MIDIKMQSAAPQRLAPKITVVGVGGAGGNAVNNMISSGLEGCEFLVCNTDSQALESSLASAKLQLGTTVTGGLGAGSRPEVGRAAADESLEEIAGYLDGSNMVFVTAGMGGGTGTGAAPVIAKACRDKGILTVGVVTKPFHFEGAHRMTLAEAGLEEMQDYVDTLIVIPNQNLFRVANEKTTFAEGFRMADGVLQSGVRGVTDLMVRPGLVNLDFADIRTAMQEMGKAMMGTGEATGDRRAIEAAEAAINNPLLDDVSMQGARGVIINITGGMDMTLFETDEACNRIRDEVDPQANIIFGATFDEGMEGSMRVSIVATGIDREEARQAATTAQGSLGGGGGGTGGGAPAPVPAQQGQGASAQGIVPSFLSRQQPPPPASNAATLAPMPAVAKGAQGEGDGELFEQNVFAPTQARPAAKQAPAATAGPGVPAASRYAGAFIPPAPVEAQGADRATAHGTYQRRPTAFPPAPAPTQARPAAAQTQALAPALLQKPAVPGPQAPAASRMPSFLERLTGMTQGGQGRPAAPAATPPAAQGKLEMRAPVAARPRDADQGGDDGLDIPAFLRRQAN